MTAIGDLVGDEILSEAKGRYAAVCERIAAAARRGGREPEDVTLVGVAKRQPRERVLAALEAGVRVLGQSYIQEARVVRPEIESIWAGDAAHAEDAIEWRFVGRLQRNKAGFAARLFDAVESVDRVELATALSKRAVQEGRELEVLIQVSLCDEPQKGGCLEGDLDVLAEKVMELAGLELKGLMTVPAALPDVKDTRRVFARLRELGGGLERIDPALAEGVLSMGMSRDFEIAIEEGATMVRVGTDLFGEREVQGSA